MGYALLQKFKDKYPEWFEEKKSPDGVSVTEEELKELKPMPFMAMVSSVGSNDEKDMYDYLGGVKNDKRSEELDAAFKQEKSNFSIVIVVDMWITGFDVPCLTYLYNDKPLKKHLLIQTISRVNRKYPGKEYGMVIDYIGIRDNMREAMKVYGGDTSVAPTADDVEQATSVFREELEILKNMFTGYDLSPFLNLECDPIERYRFLAKAAEYVFVSTEELQSEGNNGVQKVSFKTYFLKTVKRMRAAFDICQPSGYLGEEESALAQCFMAIAGFVRKMSGTASHLAITIKNEMHNEYILQKIELGNKCAVKEKIKIAIANIKLDTKRCCLGLACGDDVEIDRLRLIDFMYRAYANGKNDKVDFLVFPEFYMPLQWISDVLAFVRKSGITVVSGLQYVTSGHQAYNNVAIFAPVNTGRYTSSVLFAREKNDYAPMERQILALEKYICVDQEKPVYQMINNRGIDYGLFLCYEFTDIIARALYKDKVDIIFTPEHNRDTSYFSNIIETTARDLHVFIVQANTSIYGDSRITGPFGRNDRNVLQIKGGDKDDIIIGTIELGKVKKYQQDEKVDFDNKIQEYLKYNRKQKYEEEQNLCCHYIVDRMSFMFFQLDFHRMELH